MKRIFIIGNGFDLAHGLPTSYKDFVEFLIKDEVVTLIDELLSESEITSLESNFLGQFRLLEPRLKNYYEKTGHLTVENAVIKYLKDIKNSVLEDPLMNYKKYFCLIKKRINK